MTARLTLILGISVLSVAALGTIAFDLIHGPAWWSTMISVAGVMLGFAICAFGVAWIEKD